MANRYFDTPLGQNLVKAGFSAIRFAKKIGVPLPALSSYLHGRPEKISRMNRRRIKSSMLFYGILPAPVRKPTFCRDCRAPYPTRKIEKVPPELLSVHAPQGPQAGGRSTISPPSGDSSISPVESVESKQKCLDEKPYEREAGER